MMDDDDGRGHAQKPPSGDDGSEPATKKAKRTTVVEKKSSVLHQDGARNRHGSSSRSTDSTPTSNGNRNRNRDQSVAHEGTRPPSLESLPSTTSTEPYDASRPVSRAASDLMSPSETTVTTPRASTTASTTPPVVITAATPSSSSSSSTPSSSSSSSTKSRTSSKSKRSMKPRLVKAVSSTSTSSIASLPEDDMLEVTMDADAMGEDAAQAQPKATFTPDVRYGTQTMTGRKATNEDRFVENVMMGAFGRFFGVFDGHAGSECADFITNCLSSNILGAFQYSGPISALSPTVQQFQAEAQQYRNQVKELEQLKELAPSDTSIQGMIDEVNLLVDGLEEMIEKGHNISPMYQKAAMKSLKDGFKCTDKNFLSIAKSKGWMAGSTALTININGDSQYNTHLVLGNLGDCRAVLCRNGYAVPLTRDHKPNRPDEVERVEKMGGRVLQIAGVWRVKAPDVKKRRQQAPMLAVSRAFGDIFLKTPLEVVSYVPEIRIERLKREDYFLVVACDGVWDVMSNQEAINVAKEHYGNPEEGAKAVIQKAYEKNSVDNLTAMVIEFAWNKLPEEIRRPQSAKKRSTSSSTSSSSTTRQQASTSSDSKDEKGRGGENDGGKEEEEKEEENPDDIDDIFA